MKSGFQLVTFQVGEENFGVNIENVQEIVKVPEITRIPRSPNYVKGITNLRGDIFPVIDTHRRLNFESQKLSRNSRLIVINHLGHRTGLIVDRINEVVRLREDEIEFPPHIIKGITEEYLGGVANLVAEEDGREYLLLIMNLASFCKISIFEEEHIDFVRVSSDVQVEKVEEEELVSFILSGEEYAIKITGVKEIIRLSDIVKVPNSPAYVRGLISHREKLLPVIDLRIKFGSKIKESTDSSRIIIIDIQNILIGLLVDAVRGIIRIPKFSIEPPPSMISETESKELYGIAKLNSGQRLMMLIDLEKIISYEDLKRLEETSEDKKKHSETTEKEITASKMFIPADEKNLIVFRLNKEEFGIEISEVREINRIMAITKLPNSPDFVNGIINLRGKIMPVVNLRKRFGMEIPLEDEEYLYNARIVVVEICGKESGLIVDGVSEVIRVEKKSIEPIPEVIKSSISTEYMSGIVRIQKMNRMLIMMNLEKVLTEDEKLKLVEFSENTVATMQKEIQYDTQVQTGNNEIVKNVKNAANDPQSLEKMETSDDKNQDFKNVEKIKKSDGDSFSENKKLDEIKIKEKKVLKRAR